MSRQDPILCDALFASSTRGACTHYAKFRFVMSDGPVYYSCGMKSHQKQIEEKCTNEVQFVRELCSPTGGRMGDYMNSDEKNENFMKMYKSLTRDINESVAREMRLRVEYTSMQRHQEELEDMMHNHGHLVEAVYERLHQSARITKTLQEKLSGLFRDNQISLALKWSPDCKSQACSICLNKNLSAQNGGTLHCGHAFHNECISKWVTQSRDGTGPPTCPLCRKNVRIESVIPKLTPA